MLHDRNREPMLSYVQDQQLLITNVQTPAFQMSSYRSSLMLAPTLHEVDTSAGPLVRHQTAVSASHFAVSLPDPAMRGN
ncbi:hypothetical protein J2W17_001025 [Pseudomonas lini]|nr:hypothetical protein [Pseudomonas lini]